mmetsp:Transcript_2475/g.4834  ORF Transcript_2475/g.4834 Transcript_2475/m.4834 type:complete len:187 (+) Transcript_2475:104-664(+)
MDLSTGSSCTSVGSSPEISVFGNENNDVGNEMVAIVSPGNFKVLMEYKNRMKGEKKTRGAFYTDRIAPRQSSTKRKRSPTIVLTKSNRFKRQPGTLLSRTTSLNDDRKINRVPEKILPGKDYLGSPKLLDDDADTAAYTAELSAEITHLANLDLFGVCGPSIPSESTGYGTLATSPRIIAIPSLWD